MKTASFKGRDRDLYFVLFWLLSLVVFQRILRTLITVSVRNDAFSYIVLIPIISACLIYIERKTICVNPAYSPALGVSLFLTGSIVYLVGRSSPFGFSGDSQLSILVLAIVLMWVAGFVLFYGEKSFRAAAFPLCFLVLMVPLPTAALSRVVMALQNGSAEVADALFRLAHIPVLRQGLTFSLPGVDVEISQECSGIRSSMSLLIASLLAGHFFLRTGWRKACFSLATVFVVIFKNGVRIVTLAWLGVYVDRDFLYGSLHHRYGGLVFSILGFAILLPLLMVLHETRGLLNEDSTIGVRVAQEGARIPQADL